ncbi:MYB-related transcription factor [Salvia divinorum]|uniref:MYB-related transcription factor n=1 Tax=Salvia divinorum TaxID=28513 RepID=A0ABD1HXT4_SALDI
MAPDVCEGPRNSSKYALKKGPWTTAEDLLLLEYVKKHGEGNWNAVQRNSGLMRCGKSCRLRWANHLRPHLKKGAFSPEEERLIVELHAKMGNKWARMASELPGRTDNEIKNYWNTRVKRRQRAGLPIYPCDIAEQEQPEHHNQSRATPSLSSLLAASHPRSTSSPLITFAPAMLNSAKPLYTNNQHLKLYQDSNGGLTLSLDASNPIMSSSTFLNQGLVNQLPMISSIVQYNSLNPVNYGMGALGLPSVQLSSPPAAAALTPAASSSDGAEEFEAAGSSRSGLLEDLFGESRALAYYGKRKEGFGGNLAEEEEEEEGFGFGHGVSSYEGLEAKVSREGMTLIDDELTNLLGNSPLSIPIPNWDDEDGRESPILNNGTNSMIHSQVVESEYNPVASSIDLPNLDLNFGSWLWNNNAKYLLIWLMQMHQSSRIENNI